MNGFSPAVGVAVTLWLLLAAASAAAQPAESASEDLTVVLDVTSDLATCNLQSATRVTLETLTHSEDDWVGKCVKVGGFWWGRALFQNGRDPRTVEYSQFADALSSRRIGLYLPDELRKRTPEHPRASTAVGIVGDCELLGRGAVMVMGYCHYTAGTYLAVSEMRKSGE